eukprot:700195-Rhodomonas_salina.4
MPIAPVSTDSTTERWKHSTDGSDLPPAMGCTAGYRSSRLQDLCSCVQIQAEWGDGVQLCVCCAMCISARRVAHQHEYEHEDKDERLKQASSVVKRSAGSSGKQRKRKGGRKLQLIVPLLPPNRKAVPDTGSIVNPNSCLIAAYARSRLSDDRGKA